MVYIFIENNVWKLTDKLTEELDDFKLKSVEMDNIDNLIEFAKDTGAEDGMPIKEFFDSNNNDSYFVYQDENLTILSSGGNYFGYITKDIPEYI